jgi:hypothetical protein
MSKTNFLVPLADILPIELGETSCKSVHFYQKGQSRDNCRNLLFNYLAVNIVS